MSFPSYLPFDVLFIVRQTSALTTLLPRGVSFPIGLLLYKKRAKRQQTKPARFQSTLPMWGATANIGNLVSFSQIFILISFFYTFNDNILVKKIK